MSTSEPKYLVVWHRRRKSKFRRPVSFAVKVLGRTPSGNVIIEYRQGRTGMMKQALVQEKNLEMIEVKS